MSRRSGVFISYSRADGETFATDLRARLIRQSLGIGIVWLDRAEMQSGVGWWKQITDAIDSVEHMVLVMTPEGHELGDRQEGVAVRPAARRLCIPGEGRGR
jgi:hypothetical protein